MKASNRILLALLTVVALGAPASCSRKNDIDKEPSPGNDAGVDAAQPGTVCPMKGTAGPPMALLPATDGSKYCMDVRETTRGEYNAFLGAKHGDTGGQPPECAWNTKFTPTLMDPSDDVPPSGPYCYSTDWNGVSPDDPVSCVDFCDALAYCAWAGKRLCGRVGAKIGGQVYDAKSASVDDWGKFVQTVATSGSSESINACTQGGKTAYPYGDQLQPGACIDGTWLDAGKPPSITDLTDRSCHGTIPPFDQVYDLSGSVDEWQNLCWMGQKSCVLAGGSPLSCSESIGSTGMNEVGPGTGFRCCADLVPPAANQ